MMQHGTMEVQPTLHWAMAYCITGSIEIDSSQILQLSRLSNSFRAIQHSLVLSSRSCNSSLICNKMQLFCATVGTRFLAGDCTISRNNRKKTPSARTPCILRIDLALNDVTSVALFNMRMWRKWESAKNTSLYIAAASWFCYKYKYYKTR